MKINKENTLIIRNMNFFYNCKWNMLNNNMLKNMLKHNLNSSY